ncbi:hypothetical protein LOTGIDRAFT_63955, partial [Lottia gigantea]
LLFLVLSSFQIGTSVVLNTPLGYLRGRVRFIDNRSIFQFLNVPYAQPPIGVLRFEKPQPVLPWRGILNATEYGPACVQNSGQPKFLMSENCLVMNIYIPYNVNVSASRAVMLYIHGGGYTQGQGHSQDGSLLALTGDVIVITINYRLDVLGFLSTKEYGLPGNYGLWDQRLSFLWVRQNIASFGGDPKQVTIFGESAGAYSVGLHLVSRWNQGLFKRALSESGVTLSPRTLAYDPVSFSKSFLIDIGCFPTKTSSNVKSCLMTKSTTELLSASSRAAGTSFLAFRLPIGPVVDGDFLTKTPEELLSDRSLPFYHVDVMAGTNSGEGVLILYPLSVYQTALNINLRLGIPNRVLCDNITTSLARDYYNGSVSIASRICHMYSGTSLPEQGREVVNMFGDMSFLAPTVAVLDQHSTHAIGQTTYQYYFTQVLSSSTITRQYPWFVGVVHAGELVFVFGPMVSLAPGQYTQQEVAFSNKVQIYWTNFAKHGNPNGLHVEQWPSYITSKSYQDLSFAIQSKQNIFPNRMNLWLSLNPVQLAELQ